MLRKCKDCGLKAHTKKDIELFVTNTKSKHGHKNQCKDCATKYIKQWRTVNKDRIEKYTKQYYADNKEYFIKYYADNKERHLEVCKQWAKNNPDKVTARSARYRASKLNATPSWADHEVINDFYLEAKYHSMEIDHIIPLQSEFVCGLHVEHNLQLLTIEDNRSKSNTYWPDRW